MFITDLPLSKIYGLFDRGGVGAEVGVKCGKNARVMFKSTQPRELYLIDPWGKDADDPYLRQTPASEMQEFL
jgi:hypothetical protein